MINENLGKLKKKENQSNGSTSIYIYTALFSDYIFTRRKMSDNYEKQKKKKKTSHKPRQLQQTFPPRCM